MKRIYQLLFFAIALVMVGVAGVSCAPKGQNTPQPPLTEAYRLMDKGDNEKAAILLEQYIQQNPDSQEGKILLASAYMGEAGVDIYKLYDSFKDIIFNKPLGERFWGNGGSSSSDDILGNDSDVEGKRNVVAQNGSDPSSQEEPPIEILIDHADKILLKTKKVIEFLNRFPDVPKEKWPLLDSGLALLDSASNARDISLYRIFFRLVYMKAYLGQEFLRDPDMGRKKWLCSIDLGNLRESLDWVLKQLSAASDDVRRAYPSQASNLNSVQAIMDAFREELDGLDRSTTGANTEQTVLQNRFRTALHCGQ
jgi:hypothetical protein